jgi:hypothetical protein
MANLQIKGIDDGLYAQIKNLAASENRSVSQQVLFLIKEHLSKKKHLHAIKTPARILLELSGSWEDDRDSISIVKDIKRSRKNSKKLKKGF